MPLAPHRSVTRSSWRTVTLILVGVAFVLVTGALDGGAGVVPAALWSVPAAAPWWGAPLRIVCNALPGLLLTGVVLALTRRIGVAVVLAFTIEAAMVFGNMLKFHNLAMPLMPADFLLVKEVGAGGAELLGGYLPHTPWPYLAGLGFLAGIAILARFEPPLLRHHWRVRAPMAVVLAAALVSLVCGWSAWAIIYNPAVLDMSPHSPRATADHAGLFSSLALFHLYYGRPRPAPSQPAALALMSSLHGAIKHSEALVTPARAQPPDIVIILSESLFEPTILNGYASGTDLLPNLHRLARHGVHGWMHPPTFGGDTIRTGFEVMTGLSLRYFPDMLYPWPQIHEQSIAGIVRLLKSRGYSAVAVHGNNPGFWNRTAAFKALGFDRFVSLDDFPADDRVDDGKYLSDKSFTDELLRVLKPNGPPQFVFGISIEAHGPYDHAYGINTKVRNAIPVPATLTKAQGTHLKNYIFHIRHADQQLGRLVEVLERRQRRTIVLIFGDHLPALIPAYERAGFRNGKGFQAQPVPYLIFDTGHPDAVPLHRNVAAWMLPGMVLHAAGITGAPYFALTRVLGLQLLDLTHEPDGPRTQPTESQQRIDHGLRNIARLRLAGQLDPLWPKAAAIAARRHAAGAGTTTVAQRADPPPVPSATTPQRAGHR